MVTVCVFPVQTLGGGGALGVGYQEQLRGQSGLSRWVEERGSRRKNMEIKHYWQIKYQEPPGDEKW